MTKYSTVASRKVPEKINRPHPVWRGIGCLIIILVPIMSFAAGKLTIDYGLAHDWPIPYQLLGNPRLPDIFYEYTPLFIIFGPIATWTHFYAYAAVTLIYMIASGGFLSLVYALVYRYVGPPRWGPLDVPPPKKSSFRRYKR